MSVDYTVIFSTRQHFGDEQNVFGTHTGAEFVGKQHDYQFDCPNVDPTQSAVLMFQSYDVNNRDNVFAINNIGITGGLPVGPTHESAGPFVTSSWVGNVVVVESRPRRLKPAGNVLHIASVGNPGSFDDFMLASMVILFKTAAAPGQFG